MNSREQFEKLLLSRLSKHEGREYAIKRHPQTGQYIKPETKQAWYWFQLGGVYN